MAKPLARCAEIADNRGPPQDFQSERGEAMLPPALESLRAWLNKKGHTTRSLFEDHVLRELTTVGEALEKAKEANEDITEGLEKKSGGAAVVGPDPARCPFCERSI
jgi:hypothetical protein